MQQMQIARYALLDFAVLCASLFHRYDLFLQTLSPMLFGEKGELEAFPTAALYLSLAVYVWHALAPAHMQLCRVSDDPICAVSQRQARYGGMPN